MKVILDLVKLMWAYSWEAIAFVVLLLLCNHAGEVIESIENIIS